MGNKLLTGRRRAGSIPTSIPGGDSLINANLARPGGAVGRFVVAREVGLARRRAFVQEVRNTAFVAQARSRD